MCCAYQLAGFSRPTAAAAAAATNLCCGKALLDLTIACVPCCSQSPGAAAASRCSATRLFTHSCQQAVVLRPCILLPAKPKQLLDNTNYPVYLTLSADLAAYLICCIFPPIVGCHYTTNRCCSCRQVQYCWLHRPPPPTSSGAGAPTY
jgi:hypothetical protein